MKQSPLEQRLLKKVKDNVGASMWTAQDGRYSNPSNGASIHGFSGYKDSRRINHHIFTATKYSYNDSYQFNISSGGLVYGQGCDIPRHLEAQSINEVLAMEHLQEAVLGPVTRQRYTASHSTHQWADRLRRWTGRVPAFLQARLDHQEPYQTMEKVAEKPVLHNKLVLQGVDEPASLLQYGAFDGKEERNYIFKGRSGQMLWVDMILPQPLAEEVFSAIQQKPAFARTLAEQTVLHNLDVTENYWLGKERYQSRGQTVNLEPLRPPYETWAKNKGGITKMAFQEPGAKQLQGEDKFERRIVFPEYKVVEVKI